MLEQDRIIKINIEEEMKSSYIDYSMSVIVSRALPDVRDGFKRFKAQMPEIQKRLDKIERMAGNCDPRVIDELGHINNFLGINTQFRSSREYVLIATDFNILKTDIIDHCMCPRRT